MDALSEIGPSVTDALATTFLKLSSSQEAMEFGLDEVRTKIEERITALNQLNCFEKESVVAISVGLFITKSRTKFELFARRSW